MDTTPVIKNNYLFIPLRYLCQSIGFDIEWNETKNTVYVIQPERILYQDEDFGALVPEGFCKSDYKTQKNNFDNYKVIEIQDSQFSGILFSLGCFDFEYWINEVKENFSTRYEVLYEDNEKIIMCIFASDVQYNPEDLEEKERYFKLLDTKKQVCDSVFVHDNDN